MVANINVQHNLLILGITLADNSKLQGLSQRKLL